MTREPAAAWRAVRPGLPRRVASACAPQGWALRRLPAAARCLVAVVTSLATVAAVAAGLQTPFHSRDLLVFALLFGAVAASVEATRRVPEPAGMNANDMLGAWSLATAVLLPPVYALIAPILLMTLTQWRVRRIAVYKRVYSAAAIGLAQASGSALFHALPQQWTDWARVADNPAPLTLALLATVVVSKLLNTGLIGLAVKTADPETRWVGAFVVDNGRLELTEMCAGVLIAVVAGVSPFMVLIALPPMVMLQRGMLYAQLQTAARTDAKTGLLNAVAWEREAAVELRAAHRAGRPASVLLLDIDHFKRVNDSYGHLVGDDVLRGVAEVLRTQSRDGKDLICRFGGEEFAVFLPDMGAAEAPGAAERLRRGVADLVTVADRALVSVTVSVGVSVADPRHRPEATVSELLAAADLGLYRAKADGRDQVRGVGRPDRRTRRG